MELFNNPWFVGIGGGILSGLIVAYISRLIFSRRDNREYAQKILQANHEVLYAVRPGISEGIIPTNGVLQSLIEATARRYGVEVSDMHNLNDVSSELIKEVMDSSFISASAKQKFCEKLINIKEVGPSLKKMVFEKEYDISARYRKQLVNILSGTVGILTALAGTTITLSKNTIFEPKSLAFIAVPALVAIIISFIAVMVKELQKIRLKSHHIRGNVINAEVKIENDISKENN